MSDRSTYDDSEIEIGIVGLGTHGANHAEILADLGHEVVGVDADPQTRREFQGRYDATTYESLPDLFGTDIGAVVMTTPIKFHEPTAMEAFDADIDVFVEKPLAHSLESAERIAAMACDNFREILCVIHASSPVERVGGGQSRSKIRHQIRNIAGVVEINTTSSQWTSQPYHCETTAIAGRRYGKLSKLTYANE